MSVTNRPLTLDLLVTLAVGAGRGGAGEPEGHADAGDGGALPLATGQAGLRESIFISIIGQMKWTMELGKRLRSPTYGGGFLRIL